MSTTKNGVTSKLTHGKEEDIAKGEVSKTERELGLHLFPN